MQVPVDEVDRRAASTKRVAPLTPAATGMAPWNKMRISEARGFGPTKTPISTVQGKEIDVEKTIEKRSTNQQSSLMPGMHMWLTGFSNMPTFNGEECVVVDKSAGNRSLIRVSRICVEETLEVLPGNLSKHAPGSSAEILRLISRVVGKNSAEAILSFTTCQRCWEMCTPGTICRVKHPAKCAQHVGRRMGQKYVTYKCNACHEHYRRKGLYGGHDVHNYSDDGRGEMYRVHYCFQGEHMVSSLQAIDLRRGLPPIVTLLQGETLTYEIDALPASTIDLTVQPPHGFEGKRHEGFVGRPVGGGPWSWEEPPYFIGNGLPNLQILTVDRTDIALQFYEYTSPQLAVISLSDCHVTGVLELNNLKRLCLMDCRIDSCLLSSLENPNTLEKFAVKVCTIVGGTLTVASNALVELELIAVGILETVELWAPNIRHLGITNCSTVRRIHFFPTHNLLGPKLPPQHTSPRLQFQVDSQMTPAAWEVLHHHPHSICVLPES